MKFWEHLDEADGVLYRNITEKGQKVKQLLLPRVLRKKVLEELHGHAGHQWMEHTLALVRDRCYLDANVESWCRSCERCTLAKAPHPKINFVATRPMEVLAVDFTVLDKSSDGDENVLIMPDVFYQVHQGGYPLGIRLQGRWPVCW